MEVRLITFLAAFLIFCMNSDVCNGQTLPPPFTEKCVHNTYPPSGRPKIPKYQINLDTDPLHRWDEVGKQKSQEITMLLKKFKDFALSISHKAQFLIDLVDKDLGFLADTLPQPFKDELKGMAKATGLPLGEVIIYNIFYEIFTVCTSIIAEDSSGKLYHARNLDFGLFLGWDPENHTWVITEALRPAIIELEWTMSGKTLFKSINYAGYIGILTAVKQDVLTLTMNERFSLDGGFIGILKWILGDRSASWIGFLMRNVMEQANSYKEARRMLAETPMLAPAYFILGGNKSREACIITRSRDKAVDIWDIGTRNSTWYILETNYDNWEKPFFLDDRRTPANKCMQEMSQANVGIPGLFDVLSSKPVLNKLTTYTALMQVNSGHLEAHLQYCPDPCFPF